MPAYRVIRRYTVEDEYHVVADSEDAALKTIRDRGGQVIVSNVLESAIRAEHVDISGINLYYWDGQTK